MYVCPKCKGPLTEYRCARCQLEFPLSDGIPCFLPEATAAGSHRLRQVYDDIYRNHEDVWVDQGRSDDFLNYFRDLARSARTDTVLEVGCGEGMLLAVLNGTGKYGIDPSLQALVRAKRRSAAECAVARAEELPFPPDFFDLVVAVGVMEHFQDPDASTAEIRRVLKPTGRYIALIHTDMTPLGRLSQKAREYLFPRFRPLTLLKWLRKKLLRPISQPFKRSYTIDSARACLERNGLAITRIITRDREPGAPLAGAHVVILLAQRR